MYVYVYIDIYLCQYTHFFDVWTQPIWPGGREHDRLTAGWRGRDDLVK